MKELGWQLERKAGQGKEKQDIEAGVETREWGIDLSKVLEDKGGRSQGYWLRQLRRK